MVEEPDVSRDGGIESMIGLKVEEEILPFPTEGVRYIIPQSLDARVMNAPTNTARHLNAVREEDEENVVPSPDVRPAIKALVLVHPSSHEKVLGAMISADTAGNAI